MSRYSIYIDTSKLFTPENIKLILQKFHLQNLRFNEYPLEEFTIETPELSIEQAAEVIYQGMKEDPTTHTVLAKKDDTFFNLLIVSNKDNKLVIIINGFSCLWMNYYEHSDIEEIDIKRYILLFLSFAHDISINSIAIEHDKFMYETYEKEPMVYAYIRMELNGKWIGENLKTIISNAQKSGIVLYEDSNFSKRFTFSQSEENTEFILYAETAGYCLQVKLFHNAIECFPLPPIRFKKDVCTEVEIPDIVFYTYIMLSLCDGFLIRSLKTENFVQVRCKL